MTDDISELTARYTYGTWRAQRGWKPMHITRAEGCRFWDASGKRYLDFYAGIAVVPLRTPKPMSCFASEPKSMSVPSVVHSS